MARWLPAVSASIGVSEIIARTLLPAYDRVMPEDPAENELERLPSYFASVLELVFNLILLHVETLR